MNAPVSQAGPFTDPHGATERLGVVGESGSGKSALALSILGLIDPPGRVTGGEIVLQGRDIAGLSDR